MKSHGQSLVFSTSALGVCSGLLDFILFPIPATHDLEQTVGVIEVCSCFAKEYSIGVRENPNFY